MARQSLMWTTLPSGLTEDGSGVRVSVMVAPRLDAGDDPEKLSSFDPDWLDWPTTLAAATFRVGYGGASIDVPATETAGPSRIDAEALGTFDSEVWRAVFRPDLFVRGYRFTDLSDHKVVSYDTVALSELIRNLYAKLATASAAANGDLPRVSDLVDDPDWRELVDTVTSLDQDDSIVDYRTGLRQTDRWYERFRRGNLPLAGTKLAELARLQLFHTPPQKPTPVIDRPRLDDDRITASWMEHEQRKLPSEAELAEKLDFHQVISAMSPYPTLLRRLGLVVDLILDRGLLAEAPDAPLSTEVIFADGALAVPRTPDLSPITHARLAPGAFVAVANPSPPPGAFRVLDGLVDLDPARFSLLEEDVDGAALKLLGFARSLRRLGNDHEERVDPVTRFEKEIGAPSLRTAGLVLVQRGRGGMLEDRFATNRARNDEAEKRFSEKPAVTPELWAEDLVRGFRFDVWDRRTALWRSLCRREARYELAGGVVVAPAGEEEEGTVRLGATRSPDPKTNPVVHLHEAVIAWNGWSLAAPPPGRAVLPDDSVNKSTSATEAVMPAGIEFRSRFRPVKGSLPRLRFGREYWLRARAVDLAGNSLPPRERDFGPEQPELRAQPFLRYEPVAAPVMALVKRDDGTTEAPREGESMERLAIRSFNDTPADNAIPSLEVARRFAVPPQASVREAEQHGMLDAGGRIDSGLFDLLANQKDRDAHDPAAALIEEIIPTAGPLDPAPVPTTWAVYRDGMNLTYLPDPLATAAAVRIYGHPAVADGTNLPVWLYPGDVDAGWPEALPFKIEVFEDPGAAPQFDAESRTLKVPLGKGDRATLRLSMRLSKRALREVMGIWRWLTPADQAALESRALAGEHWMLTPWRTIEVVHAVQRPLIAPELVKLMIDREAGSTSARPIFIATCSLKSTDRVDLHAEWHEPSDDPEAAASAEIGIDRSRGDVAYAVKITDAASYATSGIARGFAEHRIAAVDQIAVGEIGHDLPNPKRHEFNDTRYRRIEYWLEATTRFREYLPASLLLEDPGTGPVPTDKHVKIVGPRKVEWVKSSAPPPAPSVLYVVPTFGWVRSEDAEGNAASWRRGGGLRVYLDRPWNVSGYGEMLGVVLPPADFAGDPDSAPAGRPYKNYVTQWGNDPIWESAFVPGLAPKRSSFPLARTGPDLAGVWLPADAPATEADQPPFPFQVSGLAAPGGASGNGTVEVAPHDVYFDPGRKLWYCDIEVNQGASYWPFIRLALARYQPVSVQGQHLSQVVLADFLPLAADRWLNVNRTADSRKRHVSVYGFTYDGSSGHRESDAIASSSVVEVWVERLDPSRGEDFGWKRESAAVVKPKGAATGLAAEAAEAAEAVGNPARFATRFVPGDQIERGLELYKDRRFAELASERLVDKIFAFLTLWEGDVTLPPNAPADRRYRLVIAEYEEYLVDDEEADEPGATKKGRRLVFVEHVELG